MSIGIGVYAKLALKDEKTVIYEYGSYNLNDARFRNKAQICDGIITIQKSCFKEPEIHEKLKKMPSGKKKLITKKIPVAVDYPTYIENGLIVVENCTNCWKTLECEENIDIMASRFLFYLFYKYQEHSELPEYVNLNY